MKWVWIFLTAVVLFNSSIGMANCHFNKIGKETSISLASSTDQAASDNGTHQNETSGEDCSKFCSHHIVFLYPSLESLFLEKSLFPFPIEKYFIPSVELRKPERPPLV